MLTVTYVKCHIKAPYAECHYAECPFAECSYAECRGAVTTQAPNSFKFGLNFLK